MPNTLTSSGKTALRKVVFAANQLDLHAGVPSHLVELFKTKDFESIHKSFQHGDPAVGDLAEFLAEHAPDILKDLAEYLKTWLPPLLVFLYGLRTARFNDENMGYLVSLTARSVCGAEN